MEMHVTLLLFVETQVVSFLCSNPLLNLSQELNRSYIQSKMVISHIIEEKNKVAVRYAHFAKTIENPKEEMLLGHFFVIWEIKEDKLYKGFQISQFS